MIQSAITVSRTLVRALVTGITTENQIFSSQHLQQQASKQRLHLVSAVAGFSKSFPPATHQTKWSYGEDAYFVASHRTAYVLGMFSFHFIITIFLKCMLEAELRQVSRHFVEEAGTEFCLKDCDVDDTKVRS